MKSSSSYVKSRSREAGAKCATFGGALLKENKKTHIK
nr:MAG TPA: hypothetical protein [Caudoviricetes sp.]